MMADLHAYLSIYGWVGELKCRTALAWQSVYGGWSVNVGERRWPNAPTLRDPSSGKLRLNDTESAAFRAIAAQQLVSGGVVGWFQAASDRLNWLGLEDADVSFLRLVASVKATSAKYLTRGRLWRSPRWDAPPPTMRLHDYTDLDPTQHCDTPLVLAELWRADDASFAVVAVNHASTPETLNVTVRPDGGAPQRVAVSMAPRSAVVRVLSGS